MEERDGGNCYGEASETVDCEETVCSGTIFDFSIVIFNLIRKILYKKRNLLN